MITCEVYYGPNNYTKNLLVLSNTLIFVLHYFLILSYHNRFWELDLSCYGIPGISVTFHTRLYETKVILCALDDVSF